MRRDRPTSANDRKSERLKTFEPISLSEADGEVRAHLLNISKTGALIHAEQTPQIGKIVQVNLLGDWHVGSVAWSSPPRFGMSFAIRLSDEKIARLTQRR